MDGVKFFKNQICEKVIIHQKNKPYECISSDETSYFIRQEGCPKGKNWCSRIPKDMADKLFKFIDMREEY